MPLITKIMKVKKDKKAETFLWVSVLFDYKQIIHYGYSSIAAWLYNGIGSRSVPVLLPILKLYMQSLMGDIESQTLLYWCPLKLMFIYSSSPKLCKPISLQTIGVGGLPLHFFFIRVKEIKHSLLSAELKTDTCNIEFHNPDIRRGFLVRTN